jgi:hypothetical protein
MACTAVTFQGVTQAVKDCLSAKLLQDGISGPIGDSGQLAGHGVTISYTWTVADATLTVNVVSKPFFISCGTVTGAIHDALSACGDQV